MDGKKINITLVTLESHNHIVGDIERGVKIYNNGGVEVEEREQGVFWARVPHKSGFQTVNLCVTRDGQDIEHHMCTCTSAYKEPPVCCHVVAAVLAVQGCIPLSRLALGMKHVVNSFVTEQNTAKAVGNGSLDVFATPMMIAMMERAACELLADVLEEKQTSVGTGIQIAHIAASPVGIEVTAEASITSVRGRVVTFDVTAKDAVGEIGRGTHTRVIVDAERFMERASQRA